MNLAHLSELQNDEMAQASIAFWFHVWGDECCRIPSEAWSELSDMREAWALQNLAKD